MRPFSKPIASIDASTPVRPSVGTDVVAQPVNTFVAPADPELSLLADSLAKVHEPLAQMQARDQERGRADAILAAKAAAEKTDNPAQADDSQIVAATPPAFQHDAAIAFNAGIGTRLGVQASSDFLQAYTEAAKGPDFNFDQFAAQFRADHLAGLGNNAALVTNAAPHLDQAIEQARADYRGIQEKRLVAQRNENLTTALSGIDLTQDPNSVMQQFQSVAQAHVAQGGTRMEAATAFFDQAAGASFRMGGRPDLFNVFFTPVPGLGNKALVDVVPGLHDKIASEQEQAVDFRIKELRRDNLGGNADFLAGVEKSLMDGSAASMSPEDFSAMLKKEVSPAGAIPSARMYGQLMMSYYEQRSKQQSLSAAADLATRGQLSLADPTIAKQFLTDAVNRSGAYPVLTNPSASPQAVDQAVQSIVSLHSSSGAAFPEERLSRYFNSIKLDVPKPGEAPSAKFLLAARVFAAMQQRSGPLSNAYFDDSTRAILSDYNRLTVNGQVDAPTALSQAYAANNPENVKAANDRMKDPTVRTQVNSSADQAISWWRRKMPFGQALGVTPDMTGVESRARQEALAYAKVRPDATVSDIQDHIAQWTQANYFREPTTNTMVEIPPAYNNQVGQDAVSNYLSIVANQPGNKDVNPRLLSKGNGTYDLFFYPKGTGGVPVKVADNVNISQMVALRSAQKVIQPDELPTIKELKDKLTTGTATAQDIRDNAALLQKVRSAGIWSAQLNRAADLALLKDTQQSQATNLEDQLRSSAFRVTNDVNDKTFNPTAAIAPRGAATADVASQFFAQGNYTGALAAMGEEVRNVAYKDPGGNTTIGIGYNMDAGNTEGDFRRAGIPVDQIDAIKAGQVHLTNDQVMRLFQVSSQRAATVAQKAVEKREPGAWAKLPPNVQAVLTDVAFQVGNLDAFNHSLDKIVKDRDFSGDDTLKVGFHDASGAFRMDNRRHTLRAAMMSSPTNFKTLLSHAAIQPANAVQQSVLASAGGTGS